MSLAVANDQGDAPVRGRIDGDGRLVEADPRLIELNLRAGGEEDGPLVVPQIAGVARLARRLGIVVSRGVVAADGDVDIDLWVRAQPDGDGVSLAIAGWGIRAARQPAPAIGSERAQDRLRAEADWYWETDAGLAITAISPQAAAGGGAVPRTVIGYPLTRIVRLIENDDGGIPLLDALAGHRRFDGQVAVMRQDESRRYHLDAVPLLDGNGRFQGFKGLARTIEETRAEDAAPTGEEPAGGEAFGERLDQALREPLGRIVSGAEKIRSHEDGALRHDYLEYATDIATAGRHLLALVDDLVDLNAIERPDFRPELEPIDLADLARRAAGLLQVRAADQRVRIDRPHASDSLPAMGEYRRTLQILVNLLGNAIRYSPPEAMVWLRCEREGALAAVVVADQGRGIAEADQEKIFEKFGRVDPGEPGGTGLGLYIARRLARAMGGDVAVDSAPGQGARFVLTLPARD